MTLFALFAASGSAWIGASAHPVNEQRACAAKMSGDVPSIVFGGGRIGSTIANLGDERDVIVKRGDPFPSEPATGPIYICTRNDALAGIVEATPSNRREDLVFMQNGMLLSSLKALASRARPQRCFSILPSPRWARPRLMVSLTPTLKV